MAVQVTAVLVVRANWTTPVSANLLIQLHLCLSLDLCPSGSCNQCPMAAPTMAPMPMMPVNPMMIAMMAGSMVGGAAGMVPMKVKRVAKRGSQTGKFNLNL